MFKIKPALRLAATVGFLTVIVIWLAIAMELVPDPNGAETQRRMSIARSVAITVPGYAENGKRNELKQLLERNLEVEPDLISIGVRRSAIGRPFLEVGPHGEMWAKPGATQALGHQLAVDIMKNKRKWGQLEFVFKTHDLGWAEWLTGFPNGLILFVLASVTLLTWAVLSKTFYYLSPSRVVPDRVRSALDSISGGLVLVSSSGEIAHANKAFCEIVQLRHEDIIGSKLDDYAWRKAVEFNGLQPWQTCQISNRLVSGEIVESKISPGVTQKYQVNASPIAGAQGQAKGMLVSFEDVTELEGKKTELAKILLAVRLSRDEVERQNEQLSFLASYDPLTSCMNRRSFIAHYENAWKDDERGQLTVVMLDIDHFKSVNDNYGHSIGDEVLKKIGEILSRKVGESGKVCRYGGEEFVILLPNQTFDLNCELAETIRLAIQAEKIAGMDITASLGISTRAFGAMDPQHMLDQADECLYAAKRNGRNQVVRFDQCPVNCQTTVSIENELKTPASSEAYRPDEMAWSSVTALLSALSFRNPQAAEHSVRVAKLAVAIGRNLLDDQELDQIEIAALLHEVGLIGVSDLDREQARKISEKGGAMRRHNDIGLEIVKNAFASENVLATIARHHNLGKALSKRAEDRGIESISVRILNVCNRLDSLVTPEDETQAMDVYAAVTQMLTSEVGLFDPIVLDRLQEFIESGRYENLSLPSKTPEQKTSMLDRVDGPTEQDTEDSELASLLNLAAEVVQLSKPEALTTTEPECEEIVSMIAGNDRLEV